MNGDAADRALALADQLDGMRRVQPNQALADDLTDAAAALRALVQERAELLARIEELELSL